MVQFSARSFVRGVSLITIVLASMMLALTPSSEAAPTATDKACRNYRKDTKVDQPPQIMSLEALDPTMIKVVASRAYDVNGVTSPYWKVSGDDGSTYQYPDAVTLFSKDDGYTLFFTGLKPGVRYTLVVTVSDLCISGDRGYAHNSASASAAITMPVPQADSAAPVVGLPSIRTYTNGLSAFPMLAALASDSSGLASVEWYVDGSRVASAAGLDRIKGWTPESRPQLDLHIGSYGCEVEASTRRVTARATDILGNVGEATAELYLPKTCAQ